MLGVGVPLTRNLHGIQYGCESYVYVCMFSHFLFISEN